MEQIRIDLPFLNYKTLVWSKKDNVTDEGRATAFESQNKKYHLAGYTAENTKYKQAFPNGKFKTFGKTLFDRFTIAVMWQMPGQTLPSHVDTFYMISKKFGVDPEDCIRINIFLEDWESGHYFEINEKPILHWQRGDAIIIAVSYTHLTLPTT